MDKFTVRRVEKTDENSIAKITKWMHDWWAGNQGFTPEATECAMRSSLEVGRLPQTYGLFAGDELLGMFQFTYYDLEMRPDIYPWLANVYVDEQYRGKGIGRALLESVEKTARENLDFDEIYLYTDHVGLYEKFGWTYAGELDTYFKSPRIQRLYKMKLR